ncbi:hypothetical protein [Nocardia yamanashiensis]|uniref:hypothetical protein n=1 Tax=Nocardia yamanashiensis TaxID=209247 RepID=UPI000B2350F8|nr:hypothetical protein [Nocardia yamanashiensis]
MFVHSPAKALAEEILARYGSLDAFCARLHTALEPVTEELPIWRPPADPAGRHRWRAA